MKPILKAKLRVILAILVLTGFVIAASFFDARQYLRSLLRWVEGLGVFGPVVFILIYIVATILFIPGFLLSLGAGVLFGVFRGSLFVLLGATAGATCSFLIARYFARRWVGRRMETHSRFLALDQSISAQGWKIVFLLRLSPLVPFNLLNYALGLTQVTLREYILASGVGMVPATVTYVYVGWLMGDLGRLGNERPPRTIVEWTFTVIGLVATVAATIYITRIAKRALSERI